jgi:hypothetical protein
MGEWRKRFGDSVDSRFDQLIMSWMMIKCIHGVDMQLWVYCQNRLRPTLSSPWGRWLHIWLVGTWEPHRQRCMALTVAMLIHEHWHIHKLPNTVAFFLYGNNEFILCCYSTSDLGSSDVVWLVWGDWFLPVSRGVAGGLCVHLGDGRGDCLSSGGWADGLLIE